MLTLFKYGLKNVELYWITNIEYFQIITKYTDFKLYKNYRT